MGLLRLEIDREKSAGVSVLIRLCGCNVGRIIAAMISREIRGLMEWSARLHRDTQRACEQSRSNRRKLMEALTTFRHSILLRDIGLSSVGCDRQAPAKAMERNLHPRLARSSHGRLRAR